MAAPTSFSNPLEKWVYQESKESLFFVNFVPIEDHFEEIRGIVADLGTVPEELREERSTKGRFCTGFMVSEKSMELKILSSAHCLDHLFTKEKPKSAQYLDKLYRIDVICDHSEDSFRQDKAVNKRRRYSQAKISEIDCEKDLILLIVRNLENMLLQMLEDHFDKGNSLDSTIDIEIAVYHTRKGVRSILKLTANVSDKGEVVRGYFPITGEKCASCPLDQADPDDSQISLTDRTSSSRSLDQEGSGSPNSPTREESTPT